MGSRFVIILVTCSSKIEAEKITASILKKRLAACGNIIDSVKSKFWWQGKIDSASEALLMLKTRTANFKRVEEEIKRIHSYEVPEIIALPIVAGSKEYLRWITDSVGQ